MNKMPAEQAFFDEKAQEKKQPEKPANERGRRRIATLLGIGVVVIVAGLVAFGAKSQSDRHADAVAVLEARKNTVPAVRAMTVKEIAGPRTIELPGNMAAFDQATLFARATGYIAQRNVDIGSKVKKGDILAVIAAPDLDAQLAQARGQLEQFKAAVLQAQANADLGKVTDQRTSRLVQQGWSSAQQGDQDRLTAASSSAALAVARANVVAQEAAVNRLVQLTGFEQVTAPFDGVITSRLIDVGSLVTADAASGTSLFSIQRTDVLRVQVWVPQAAYFGIKDGDHAVVTVPELPGRTFDGVVARNARSLGPGTRTLLAEVDVDNKNGELTAGLYGILHLQVQRQTPTISIPSQAVIFNKDGLSAAVVDDQGKVQLRKLDVEYDNGADVEVRDGLKPGDKVILSPPATVSDGMQVKIQEPPPKTEAKPG
ncbi:efflux RND transporter periplasmic adaptor subunit [Methyloferula stellata]|uniref:efflux RND transporter periplasmic adaptor subunit n=1 Tax=Methyloferula stellata TaxID=876270 RepID=UPI00037A38CF|nr:efflux RND transporter periplasmic adaptor subunit [Methyloferula stellata]